MYAYLYADALFVVDPMKPVETSLPGELHGEKFTPISLSTPDVNVAPLCTKRESKITGAPRSIFLQYDAMGLLCSGFPLSL